MKDFSMKDELTIDQSAMAEAAENAANCLRALSNPSRLLLLCELLGGNGMSGILKRHLAWDRLTCHSNWHV